MEANEIVMNEEVMDATEKVVSTSSRNGWTIFGVTLTIVGLGYVGYMSWKNRKAKKERFTIPEDKNDECHDDECDAEDVE